MTFEEEMESIRNEMVSIRYATELLKKNKLQIERLEAILGLSDPWPLSSTLKKLCEATEHLKIVHMCDNDGHEQYWIALEKGREYIATIENVLKSRGN